MMNLTIEEWTPGHQRWQELVQMIDDENQTHWAFNSYFEQFARHFLVALKKNEIVGFLMFVVWEIGPHDREHKVIRLCGKVLTEAKVIAFGVRESHRRQGVGRLLQEQLLKRAKQLARFPR